LDKHHPVASLLVGGVQAHAILPLTEQLEGDAPLGSEVWSILTSLQWTKSRPLSDVLRAPRGQLCEMTKLTSVYVIIIGYGLLLTVCHTLALNYRTNASFTRDANRRLLTLIDAINKAAAMLTNGTFHME
jgi:hypothetical protein